MRPWLLSLALLAAPALAEPPAKIVVAPAGQCAGEERDLVLQPLPKPAASEPAASVLHLTPNQVAASSGTAGAPPPAVGAFAGPGACDNPGSGCAFEKIVDDPDPGTGCGFPGSPCP